jgi:hypothetical protein
MHLPLPRPYVQREYLKYRPGFLEEWVLKDNELLRACDDLLVLQYQVTHPCPLTRPLPCLLHDYRCAFSLTRVSVFTQVVDDPEIKEVPCVACIDVVVLCVCHARAYYLIHRCNTRLLNTS